MSLLVAAPPLHHIYMTGPQSEAVVDDAGPTTTLAEPAMRLASTAGWRRLKDLMFSLIAGRNDQANLGATLADVGRGLGDLEVPPDAAAVADVLLFDHGHDVGRHLLAKGLLHDDLSDALSRLAAHIEGAGLGRLEIGPVFHRKATVHLAAPEETAGLARPFVAGLLHGSLCELFNSLVRVERDATTQITIRLGPGLDVNEQEKQDG